VSYRFGAMQPAPTQSAPMQPMQAGPMQAGPMQTGPMQGGPESQSMADGMASAGPCCCDCQRIPEWQAFGDFLYLRPRNANVAYGVLFSTASQPENSPVSGVPTIELANPGVASIDYHPGFRVGMARAFDDCNAVVATFTHYEGEDQSSITSLPSGTNPATGLPFGEIRSLVSHPSVWGLNSGDGNATDDWVSASSDYQMIYSLADVDFRWTFSNQNDTRLSVLAGMRYVSLDQRLDVLGMSPGNTGTGTGGLPATPFDVQDIHSQINFEGGGLRIGFEGERRTPHGLVFYGRAAASLVAGTFRCNYTQTSGLFGTEVATGDSVDRVMPMIDCELGTGISLWNDKLRLTTGYSFSGWFNLVRTDEFIGAVRSANFTGMSNALTFDGFVSRVELQF
jgi:hypothetical protein